MNNINRKHPKAINTAPTIRAIEPRNDPRIPVESLVIPLVAIYEPIVIGKKAISHSERKGDISYESTLNDTNIVRIEKRTKNNKKKAFIRLLDSVKIFSMGA